MRFIVSCVTAVLMTAIAPASAQPQCGKGKQGVLELVEWSATAKPPAVPQSNAFVGTHLVLTLKNVGPSAVRMVDGTVWFSDVLGRSIGGVVLPPDLRAASGEAVSVSRNMADMRRLLDAEKADLVAIACIESVVYDDGRKETF